MDATAAAMQNPILVAKIANALNYKSLKTCRSLNSLWYEEVTKVLKKKSVILVSRDTIPKIMKNDPNSTDIFCKAVRINSSFSLGDTPWILNFFGLYAKELEFIDWTDSTAIPHLQDEEEYNERKFTTVLDWNYDLLKLTQLNLKPRFAFGTNLTLILKSAPNLKILRVDFVPYDFHCTQEFLEALQAQSDLSHIKTLQFGNNTHLKESHIQVLIGLPSLELDVFIMEGHMVEIRSGWVFKAILERWSYTLESVIFPTVLPFRLTKIMPRLKNLEAGNFRLKRTMGFNIQFPSLEYFHFSFDPRFKLDEFIPPDMDRHPNMSELNFMKDCIPPQPFVSRMFDKFPYLTVLAITTTDEFLQTIYTSCPNLKSFYIMGSFTDQGVTGIRHQDLDGFYGILMASGNIIGEDLIEKRGLRRWKSILDLKHLETLSLNSESVGDKSVLWGVLGCTKHLKKLYLTPNVTDESLNALMGMKELRELCIPQPNEGHISYEGVKSFSANMIHVQLLFGTNHPN